MVVKVRDTLSATTISEEPVRTLWVHGGLSIWQQTEAILKIETLIEASWGYIKVGGKGI